MAEVQRRRCVFTVESKGRDHGKVRGGRPWWRRDCKRWAVEGGRFCWQHNDGLGSPGNMDP